MVSLLSGEDRRMRIYSEMVRKAVQSCYQEEPTNFLNYIVYDPGAYPEPLMREDHVAHNQALGILSGGDGGEDEEDKGGGGA
ncbi:MAG: hypothetical protein QXE79_01205 [Candidatus Bathyarchaeia archaeon]